MNIPLPSKSCGQIVFAGADVKQSLTSRYFRQHQRLKIRPARVEIFHHFRRLRARQACRRRKSICRPASRSARRWPAACAGFPKARARHPRRRPARLRIALPGADAAARRIHQHAVEFGFGRQLRAAVPECGAIIEHLRPAGAALEFSDAIPRGRSPRAGPCSASGRKGAASCRLRRHRRPTTSRPAAARTTNPPSATRCPGSQIRPREIPAS